MRRVTFFVDGFNMYHALNTAKYMKYKWLDLTSLAAGLISKNVHLLQEVYYFTALAHWNHNKVNRHKVYLKALQLNDVKIVKGKFKEKDKYCPLCKRRSKTFEGKETDVNIALHLLKLAYENKYDVAMILSGDSDLIPAIREVKKNFREKEIIVIIPPGRKAESLKQESDRYIRLKEHHLNKSQFSNKIVIDSHNFIEKPTNWR